MSMRDTVRGLLGNKKSQHRLGDQEQHASTNKPGSYLPPQDLVNGGGGRVFPIRNGNGEPDDWLAPNFHSVGRSTNGNSAHSESRSLSNAKNITSDFPGPPSTESHDLDHRKVFQRSQFIEPSSATAPPNVIPGGAVSTEERPAFRRCEDEPIHTPGAVQNYGAMLGLKYNEKRQLEVRVASENTRKVLGYGPEQLFKLDCFLDALGQEDREEMVAHITHSLDNSHIVQDETRLDIFQLTLTFQNEPSIRLWTAMHIPPNQRDLIICEFEFFVDAFYNRDLRAAKALPIFPAPSMGFEITDPQELRKSTTSASKPLPVIEIAKQRKDKGFTSLDLFNALSQAQKQISSASSVINLQEVVVGLIAEITGFHRVMFYRFDEKNNGHVDAEMLNPQASTDVFRGMHYPATDIPTQARRLYIINRVRLLQDIEADTARLVCRDEKEFSAPLDLTHSYLRAMSPVHCKYLKNMAVRSSMSISVVINNKLWGLIACHSYGDDGIRVSLPIRELCRNIGECSAVNIKQLQLTERIEARRPPSLNLLPPNTGVPMASSSAYLLRIVDADFGLLSIDGEARAVGKLDPYSEALAVMSHVQAMQLNGIRSSQNINQDFPGIAHPGGIKIISGFLFVPFSGGNNERDFLIFFRKGKLKHVNWAGNPYEKKFKGSEYLTPRSSFARWGESIEGTSREWTEDQRDAAWVLSVLYTKLIEILGHKGTTAQKQQISCIRASSHNLRVPLNAIINCLELALDKKIDDRTRQILAKAQEASASLANVMEELLRLTKIDEAPARPANNTFNLNLTVQKVMKALQREAQRKALDLTLSVHEQLPGVVKGDGELFKLVLAKLINHAFRRSKKVSVDVNLIRTEDLTSVIGLSVQDTGPGMSESELDSVFYEFEKGQVKNDEDDWLGASEDPHVRSDHRTIGGLSELAMIARYVWSADGQIRVTSEQGKGTIFTLELPFEHVPSIDAVGRKLRKLFATSSGKVQEREMRRTAPAAIKVPAHSQFQRQYQGPSSDQESHGARSSGDIRNDRDARDPQDIRNTRDTQKLVDQEIDDAYYGETNDTLSPLASPALISPKMHENVSRPAKIAINRNSIIHQHNPALGSGARPAENQQVLTPIPSPQIEVTPTSSPLQPERRSEKQSDKYSDKHSEKYSDKHSDKHSESDSFTSHSSTPVPALHKFNILVAEDNFVTQRMLEKKLSAVHHHVIVANDGQEAHDKFVAQPPSQAIDVILMDLKMPLVDGALSARMIRFWEKESAASNRSNAAAASDRRQSVQSSNSGRSRVALIAVGTSLEEDDRFALIQNGFDGWIVKPVDFKRLDLMMQGLRDKDMKREGLYVPGTEMGGWFFP